MIVSKFLTKLSNLPVKVKQKIIQSLNAIKAMTPNNYVSSTTTSPGRYSITTPFSTR